MKVHPLFGFSWLVFALVSWISLLYFFGVWSTELRCERDFNVYDCESEWYPVYGEEIEEELTP